MSIYLHKILPIIFSPLTVVMVSLIWGSLKFKSKILGLATLLVILSSMPVVANFLANWNEKGYDPISAYHFPNVDGIIVLSGQLVTINRGKQTSYEMAGSIDRFFTGLRLAKANKNAKLIFTRGKMPWKKGLAEGVVLAEMAKDFGVPSNQIAIPKRNATNTFEEAQAVSSWMGSSDLKFLLVTSAFHMPRAQKIFESEGLDVTPIPVDFSNAARSLTVLDYIPNAASLSRTSSSLREQIGRLYYAIKFRSKF